MTKQELTMVLQESPMYTVNHPTHMTSFTLQCRLAYAICYPILTLLYTVYISMCQISRHLFPVALPVRPVYHGSKRGRRYHWRRHRCAQHLKDHTPNPQLDGDHASYPVCARSSLCLASIVTFWWKPMWYTALKGEQGLKIHQGNTFWNTKFQSLIWSPWATQPTQTPPNRDWTFHTENSLSLAHLRPRLPKNNDFPSCFPGCYHNAK